MEAIGNVISKVKDGYLAAVGWVAAHPHKTIGAALIVILLAAWF